MAGEDLATDIAQNIGYMPIVNKIGEAGSGFLNFLSNLIPSGGSSAATPPPAAAAKAAAPQQMGMFDRLLNSIRSTGALDAFDVDMDKIREGKLPPHLMDAANMAMMMAGTGPLARGLGPGMLKSPSVPAWAFDPKRGWYVLESESLPSMDPLKSLIKGNALGSDWSKALERIMNLYRSNTKGL